MSSDMQSGAPRERSAAAGRTDATRRRSAGTAPARRPSGFAAPDAKPRPAPSARSAAPAKPQPGPRERPIENKRRRREQPGRWRIALIALGCIVILIFVIALIAGSGGGTYHQLPTIRRIEDAEPAQSASPEDGGAAEAGEIPAPEAGA